MKTKWETQRTEIYADKKINHPKKTPLTLNFQSLKCKKEMFYSQEQYSYHRIKECRQYK